MKLGCKLVESGSSNKNCWVIGAPSEVHVDSNKIRQVYLFDVFALSPDQLLVSIWLRDCVKMAQGTSGNVATQIGYCCRAWVQSLKINDVVQVSDSLMESMAFGNLSEPSTNPGNVCMNSISCGYNITFPHFVLCIFTAVVLTVIALAMKGIFHEMWSYSMWNNTECFQAD